MDVRLIAIPSSQACHIFYSGFPLLYQSGVLLLFVSIALTQARSLSTTPIGQRGPKERRYYTRWCYMYGDIGRHLRRVLHLTSLCSPAKPPLYTGEPILRAFPIGCKPLFG